MRRYVYLSGAIDLDPNLGRDWRTALSLLLSEVGIESYDPVKKQEEITGMSTGRLLTLRRRNEELFKDLTRRTMDKDLHVIANDTAAVVSVINEYARMGTYAEIGLAYYLKVPIYVIAQGDSTHLSGWTISAARLTFSSLGVFERWVKREYEYGRRALQIFE
jgi:hypothetical protein